MHFLSLNSVMTIFTKRYLSVAIIAIVILIAVLVNCLFWIKVLKDVFLPYFINEIDKIDWYFIVMLCFSLLIWYLYFSILKSQVRFFTIVPEGKEITNRYSLFGFLLNVWLFCLLFSGFLGFVFRDSEHGIDYAVVSFLISIPYFTFNFIKYYIWGKKKTDLKD